MEISKILNPSAGSSSGSQPPQKGKSNGTSPSNQGGSSKEWEEKMRKKGMPIEGLNTFRVKKQ